LKTPYGNPIQPVEYTDDYGSGLSTTAGEWRDALVDALARAGAAGLTDAEAVQAVFKAGPKDDAYHAYRKKIARQLQRWTDETDTAYERVETVRDGKEYKVWRIKTS
ncbi:hypothetical protein, partial [Mycobacterium avium]